MCIRDRIYASAERYQAEGKPMAWMMTIAKNLSRMRLRDAKRTSDLPEEEWERYLSSKPGVTVEDRLLLRAALKPVSYTHLTPQCRCRTSACGKTPSAHKTWIRSIHRAIFWACAFLPFRPQYRFMISFNDIVYTKNTPVKRRLHCAANLTLRQ